MRNEAIQQTDGTWAVYINGGCKAHHLTLSQVSEQFEGLKFTILSARELGVGEQRNNYGTPSITAIMESLVPKGICKALIVR